jgi:hypothetical protein
LYQYPIEWTLAGIVIFLHFFVQPDEILFFKTHANDPDMDPESIAPIYSMYHLSFFWSVGVSGVLVSAKNLGFSVFRVQIWRCALFQMKNSNKMGEISESNWGYCWCPHQGIIFRVQGAFPNMEIVAMQK